MWSSGQSSCIQIQMSGFDSQRYQIFSERVPLSLVSTLWSRLKEKVAAPA
jgi:hypothetical protein